MSECTREHACVCVCARLWVGSHDSHAHPAPGVLGDVWMSSAMQQGSPRPQSGWEWPGAAEGSRPPVGCQPQDQNLLFDPM